MSEVTWVDRPDGVERAAEAVRGEGRCALDTEADSLHSYFHKVCLVQLTVGGRSFVIDPLALAPGSLEPLWEVVGAPEVSVVMHGADYDLRVLDRDYGARIRGLEDTQSMALLLGEPKTGLAAMLAKELGVELDKEHQRADWGRRPLPAAMLAYAAADTVHLDRLAAQLRARLEELGRWGWAQEEFRRLEAVRHVPPVEDPLAFERIKGARRLRGAARDRLLALYRWREDAAQRRDVPPFKVLGNRELIAIAEAAPEDLHGLAALPGVGPRLLRRVGKPVLAAIRRPQPAPERQPSPRLSAVVADERRRREAVVAARDAAAAELGIEPGVLCPRAVLEAIAAASTSRADRAGLAAAGLDGWRGEVLGEVILAALRSVAG